MGPANRRLVPQRRCNDLFFEDGPWQISDQRCIGTVPKGRLRVAQHAVLGLHPQRDQSRQGRLRIAQDVVLGGLDPRQMLTADHQDHPGTLSAGQTVRLENLIWTRPRPSARKV
jgi:hypothetical protein